MLQRPCEKQYICIMLNFSNDNVPLSALERTPRNQGNDALLGYQGALKANTSWVARLTNLLDNLKAMILPVFSDRTQV